jgi:hypothetical protein
MSLGVCVSHEIPVGRNKAMAKTVFLALGLLGIVELEWYHRRRGKFEVKILIGSIWHFQIFY